MRPGTMRWVPPAGRAVRYSVPRPEARVAQWMDQIDRRIRLWRLRLLSTRRGILPHSVGALSYGFPFLCIFERSLLGIGRKMVEHLLDPFVQVLNVLIRLVR